MTQYRIVTICNHPIVITIRYWVITVITIQYWVIPQLLQYDTESFHNYYNTILSFHSYYNTLLSNSVSYCNNCGMTLYCIVILVGESVPYWNNCRMIQNCVVITVWWLSIAVNTIQYWVISKLLQYDTDSPHSYHNTILNHPTAITIRYWVIP
jgi:hypothetical protein